MILNPEKPRPEWLRKKKQLSPSVLKTKRRISSLGLHTVCESARCPNLSECFCAGNATFLILGDRCTRNCGFCAVEHGMPVSPDPEEGMKIARYILKLKLHYAVITSVTRDDLEDGGASHFIRVVSDIREELPRVGIELLVPDFGGQWNWIERVAALPIEVFAHNMETVRSLYPLARRGADYSRSLEVLLTASSKLGEETLLKSGLMVGLGEDEEELQELFRDLAACGVKILTIGQYLRPGRENIPVKKYYRPEEFEKLEKMALSCGVAKVVSGPYVRSSYLAEKSYLEGKMFDKANISTYNS